MLVDIIGGQFFVGCIAVAGAVVLFLCYEGIERLARRRDTEKAREARETGTGETGRTDSRGDGGNSDPVDSDSP